MRISVNCIRWAPAGATFGTCSEGLYGGRPSPGVCRACPARAPVDKAAMPLSGPWPPPEASPTLPPARPDTVSTPVLSPTGLRYEKRPRPTLSMVKAWAVAATKGRYVPPAVLAERDAICGACDKARTDAKGRWCGACGCAVAPEGARLRNLAAYAENMPGVEGYNPEWPAWGCKHPERGRGKGWPLPVLRPG